MILIADDSRFMRYHLKSLLKKQGFRSLLNTIEYSPQHGKYDTYFFHVPRTHYN